MLIVFIAMLQVMSALISKAQQALHDDVQPLDKLASAFSPLPAVTATNDTFEVALRSALNVSVPHASAAADTGAADSADCSLNNDDEQMMLAMACYISDSPHPLDAPAINFCAIFHLHFSAVGKLFVTLRAHRQQRQLNTAGFT
jgi:hypothetical protein